MHLRAPAKTELSLHHFLLQIYQAERPDWPVRVYNLLYEDSQEADKFSAAVAREVDLLAPQSCHVMAPDCPEKCLLQQAMIRPCCVCCKQYPVEGPVSPDATVLLASARSHLNCRVTLSCLQKVCYTL